MLPQHRDQDKNGRDKNDDEGDLADGPRRERFDLALGTLRVFLFVPAGEGGKEEEANEGKDDCDDAVFLYPLLACLLVSRQKRS